jgi:hypothetical protein
MLYISPYLWIIYQIVHGTKGHMAVYGLGCHPQNIIWIEARFTKISDMYINYSSFEMNFSKSLIFFLLQILFEFLDL